jgi:hypothetical protein
VSGSERGAAGGHYLLSTVQSDSSTLLPPSRQTPTNTYQAANEEQRAKPGASLPSLHRRQARARPCRERGSKVSGSERATSMRKRNRGAEAHSHLSDVATSSPSRQARGPSIREEEHRRQQKARQVCGECGRWRRGRRQGRGEALVVWLLEAPERQHHRARRKDKGKEGKKEGGKLLARNQFRTHGEGHVRTHADTQSERA